MLYWPVRLSIHAVWTSPALPPSIAGKSAHVLPIDVWIATRVDQPAPPSDDDRYQTLGGPLSRVPALYKTYTRFDPSTVTTICGPQKSPPQQFLHSGPAGTARPAE